MEFYFFEGRDEISNTLSTFFANILFMISFTDKKLKFYFTVDGLPLNKFTVAKHFLISYRC